MDTLSVFLMGDPLTTLELCALAATLCYMAKLVLASSIPQPISTTVPNPLHPVRIKERTFERRLLSFFNVGGLISLPKRSLHRQKILG